VIKLAVEYVPAMSAEELKELVAKSALLPLHIYTTDGAKYVLNHPEIAVVSRSMMVIGMGLDDPATGIPERLAFCPLAQIARIETFPKTAA
jgi:hypothetical protein